MKLLDHSTALHGLDVRLDDSIRSVDWNFAVSTVGWWVGGKTLDVAPESH